MKDKKNNSMKTTVVIISIIAGFSILFFFISVGYTIYLEGLYKEKWNLSSNGIDFFYKKIQGSTSIITSAVWAITSIVTVSGIIVALKTYNLNIKNNAITNHISHFEMFRDYINSEIDKRDMLNAGKINVFCFYNLMFPNSRDGNLELSDTYQKFISSIKGIIEDANSSITTETGNYEYKRHQRAMIEKLSEVGIILSNGPKNNFIIVETEIFSFIDNINSAFSSVKLDELSKIKRDYT
ncbi:retron Ec48 family effector membrane protein [Providencia sp. 21OH12SH02B-Prov]|uniref:retron Ec48 family effector membrane protein n=1 Tax=unclassified Providencia TaxID=2633465 RepID=UPI0022B6327C|nr:MULTISPECIES: retron Ec48 family effector membrane protein [unclassified Providencia]ELR5119487.1 retron Ec48 family effector membrane protein [Providencia stuartii]WBA58574.1 retron Ec48 family effector membrane protein [Providencia sp. 21OH12SH02B-Prov]